MKGSWTILPKHRIKRNSAGTRIPSGDRVFLLWRKSLRFDQHLLPCRLLVTSERAPPLFVVSSSGGLTLEVISQEPKRPRAPFQVLVLCLSGQTDPPALFVDVQLRGLEARGHKPKISKRPRTPLGYLRLMLFSSDQAPSAFS